MTIQELDQMADHWDNETVIPSVTIILGSVGAKHLPDALARVIKQAFIDGVKVGVEMES